MVSAPLQAMSRNGSSSNGRGLIRRSPLAQRASSQLDGGDDFVAPGGLLAAGNLPDYSFVAPNLCNDAHDCSLATADQWLQTNIDPLVKNAAFQRDGLLVITFDESSGDNVNGGGHVATVIVSPKAKHGYEGVGVYEHQSLLRLTAQALGVTPPNAAATAPDMGEFFSTTGTP